MKSVSYTVDLFDITTSPDQNRFVFPNHTRKFPFFKYFNFYWTVFLLYRLIPKRLFIRNQDKSINDRYIPP